MLCFHGALFIKVSCGRSLMFLTQKITSSVWEGKGEIHQSPDHHIVIRRGYSGSTNSCPSHNSLEFLWDWKLKVDPRKMLLKLLQRMSFVIFRLLYNKLRVRFNPWFLYVCRSRSCSETEKTSSRWHVLDFWRTGEREWPRHVACCGQKSGLWAVVYIRLVYDNSVERSSCWSCRR